MANPEAFAYLRADPKRIVNACEKIERESRYQRPLSYDALKVRFTALKV